MAKISRRFVARLRFGADGLIPAIIQDRKNGEVLMLGYMNREALRLTLEGPHVVFYSRSREELWRKGATSGHVQTVREVRADCDLDALLVKVDQKVAACHEGYRSCFFRKAGPKGLAVVGKRKFFPRKKG